MLMAQSCSLPKLEHRVEELCGVDICKAFEWKCQNTVLNHDGTRYIRGSVTDYDLREAGVPLVLSLDPNLFRSVQVP